MFTGLACCVFLQTIMGFTRRTIGSVVDMQENAILAKPNQSLSLMCMFCRKTGFIRAILCFSVFFQLICAASTCTLAADLSQTEGTMNATNMTDAINGTIAENMGRGALAPASETNTPQIEAIEISPQDPTTLKDVTLRAVLKEAPDYEITGYVWTVKDDVTASVEYIGDTNPFSFTPPEGKYGNKVANCRVLFKHKLTGNRGIDKKSEAFQIFFEKGPLNTPEDDDSNGVPNWFEYWKKDEAVPEMEDAEYDDKGAGYGYWDQNKGRVYLCKAAGGIHYPKEITVTTNVSTETFGGPKVKGTDCAAQVVAHENYHKKVTNELKGTGTDSDKWQGGKSHICFDEWNIFGWNLCVNGKDYDKGDSCPDGLPDSYETDTTHTDPDKPDTWNLEEAKGHHPKYKNSYATYGDQEYMAMHTANETAGDDQTKDWANPGKQTKTKYGPSYYAAAKPLNVTPRQSPAQSSIEGSYIDSAVDSNGNGLFDTLNITFDVEVMQDGSYDLIGALKDNLDQEIELVNNRFDLLAGVNKIELAFKGLKINRHEADGPYTFSVALFDEEGKALDFKNNAHQTAAYKFTDFEGQQANIVDSFTDMAEECNGDGIFDNLKIKVNLDVRKSENYTVEGFLYGQGDNPIASAKTKVLLDKGLNEVELTFNGRSIAFFAGKGPYRLRHFSLYDQSGTRLGFEQDPYQTKEYDALDFKSNDASLKDFNDTGQDSNGDGFFEYLMISVEVDVLKPGNYVVEGNLCDFEGNEIEKTYAQMYLEVGKQTVPLMFKGKTIYTNEISGVFRLTDMLLYDEFGIIKDAKNYAYTTGNYNYNAFKPIIALTGDYTENGEDTNGNSLFDNLVINVGVEVTTSGNVVAKARLLDASGKEILWASNTTWVPANQQKTKRDRLSKSVGSSLKAIPLRFNGQKIYDHGANGPYLLRDLNIYHASDPAFPDCVNEAYTTSAHKYQEFEHNNPPGKPTDPNGPIKGFVKTQYEYAVLSTDPEGDMVKYTFDWGDATSETKLTDSGTSMSASHTWTKAGTYQVKAMATDSKGATSGYSRSLTVTVNPNNSPNVPGKPSGSATCIAGSSYSYSTSAIDTDKDQVKYTFDWADGTKTDTNLVNSGTKSSAIHAWSAAGTYQVKAMAMDSKGATSGYSSSLTVTVNPNRSPNAPGKPSGSIKGYAGTAYSYVTSAKDSDGDQVKYIFDWGDGTKTDTKMVNSGTRSSATHAWSKAGTYQVKANAMDSKGALSGYSGYLSVTISPNGVPGKPSVPSGAITGKIKKSNIYKTSTTDPDGDKLKYTFNWGDGKTSATSFVNSGTSARSSHAWSNAGTYQVKVMATDSKGASSVSWSSSLAVTIT
jgi:hypothetical protein